MNKIFMVYTNTKWKTSNIMKTLDDMMMEKIRMIIDQN